MYSLPKPSYDPATTRAVALAYRRERQAGRLDAPARIADHPAKRIADLLPWNWTPKPANLAA